MLQHLRKLHVKVEYPEKAPLKTPPIRQRILDYHLQNPSMKLITVARRLNIPYQTVQKVIKIYSKTGSIERRKAKEKIPDLKLKVSNELANNPDLTGRELAKKLGSSITTIHRVMKEINFKRIRPGDKKCPHCGDLFVNEQSFREHIESHENQINNTPYECNLCDYKIFNKRSMDQHKRKAHQIRKR